MKRSSHALGVAVALVTTLALVACGDSGSNDDALGLGDRDLDRCSLMTVEEAESWLGPLEEEPAPVVLVGDDPDPVTCAYDGSRTRVLIQIRDGAVYFAEEGSAARGDETIEGLGEDAHTDGDSVSLLQNDWTASVSYISGQPLTTEELIEMAELISSRLP